MTSPRPVRTDLMLSSPTDALSTSGSASCSALAMGSTSWSLGRNPSSL